MPHLRQYLRNEKFNFSSADSNAESVKIEKFRTSKALSERFIRDKRLAQPRIILGDFSSSPNVLTVNGCKNCSSLSKIALDITFSALPSSASSCEAADLDFWIFRSRLVLVEGWLKYFGLNHSSAHF
jgi:hypothetical protein